MNASFLPPDDLPSPPTPLDRLLRLRLEEAIDKYFLAQCDRITQILLSKSQWNFKITEEALILMIKCHERETYWQILGIIEQLGHYVEQFAGEQALIRVFPSDHKGLPLTIQVSEISAYWDWLEKRSD